jgi:hypothetical protein
MAAVVVVSAWLVTVAGCGSGSGPPSAADRAFLSEVDGSAPGITALRSSRQLTGLGHAVCDGFKSGASYEELADRLALLPGSSALPAGDLGVVIMAAADNYCPQYRNRV